nr:endonuclease MutS2 [Saprospiraceae bacterium]
MIYSYPSNINQILEFDKIQSLITAECVGPKGDELIRELTMIVKPEKLQKELDLIRELNNLYHTYSDFRVFSYKDISPLEKYTHIQGYVYELDLVVEIKYILKLAIEIKAFTSKFEEVDYPEVHSFLQQIEPLPELYNFLNEVVDDEGDIFKNATPELAGLHRLLASKQRETDQKFTQIVRRFQSQGFLTDNKESLRNGRRVLSVPAEHKRRIKGIIHDESASGKTCFIEPDEVISVNNDLFEIERSIKREEYKVLQKISLKVSENGAEIMDNYHSVGTLDALQAKVKFAVKTKGVVPTLQSETGISLQKAKHPLLLIKYNQEGREVVPFDLSLNAENRLLLVSGPNAGGKSVLLKSVGILQMMFQCAIPIPVGAGTKMGIFSSLFADVGDQQSLEDDLSTYSSHLTNMKHFLARADQDTLLLIDEFGSGTDPRIGGALAEGILRRFRSAKAYGVITTHYGNLKIYGNNASGILNGAMVFDRKNMKPTYQFLTGKPGSSFGFEIAERVGIHPYILKYARDKAGKKIEEVDSMLADLQKEKSMVEKRLRELELKEKELRQMAKNFEHLHREIEIRRKKMKLNKKEYQLAVQAKMKKEFELELKKIKREHNLEKAQKSYQSLKAKVKNLAAEKEQLKEKLAEEELGAHFKWEVGSHAKLRSGSEIGRLVDLRKKKATLEFQSGLRMEVSTADLIPVNTPIDKKKEKSVSTDVDYTGAGFNPRLDIRGLRYREAVDLLSDYFEKALLSNQSRLEITHGKGGGALRKALIQTLKDFPANISMTHPPEEEGGMGKSILTIN